MVNRRNDMGFMALNWLWIVIAIGLAFYFFRRNSGKTASGEGTDSRKSLDGPRPHEDAGHGVQPASVSDVNTPDAAIDSVSGKPLSTAGALTSVHLGKVYYFSNKENRDRFEASPEEFAEKAAGHAVPGSDAQPEHRHRHGC
jgi:YHS domain-containing protein